MDNKLSRRGFIKKSVIAMGTVSVCNLTGRVLSGKGNAFNAFASEELREVGMSHVSVKLWPGRSEQAKQLLADAIADDVVCIIGCGEDTVSVSIEDVSSGNWKEKVYDPEIRGNTKNLYKKPGYSL